MPVPAPPRIFVQPAPKPDVGSAPAGRTYHAAEIFGFTDQTTSASKIRRASERIAVARERVARDAFDAQAGRDEGALAEDGTRLDEEARVVAVDRQLVLEIRTGDERVLGALVRCTRRRPTGRARDGWNRTGTGASRAACDRPGIAGNGRIREGLVDELVLQVGEGHVRVMTQAAGRSEERRGAEFAERVRAARERVEAAVALERVGAVRPGESALVRGRPATSTRTLRSGRSDQPTPPEAFTRL